MYSRCLNVLTYIRLVEIKVSLNVITMAKKLRTKNIKTKRKIKYKEIQNYFAYLSTHREKLKVKTKSVLLVAQKTFS